MKKTKFLVLIFLLFGLLTSCNYPNPTNPKQFQETEISSAVTKISKEYGVKSTVYILMTQTSSAMIQKIPTTPINTESAYFHQTPISNLSISTQTVLPASVIPTDNSQSSNCEKGEFIDEAVPDGSKTLTDQIFEQTWIIQNTGCNTWTNDYSIVFVNGSRMNAPERVMLDVPIPSGKLLKIGTQFKAPHEEGRYKSIWMLQDKAGRKFGLGNYGQGFWVDVIVVGTAVLTPSPATLYPTSRPLPTLPLLPTLPGNTYPTYDPRLPLPTLPLLPTLPGGNHPTYDPRLPLPTLPPLIIPTDNPNPPLPTFPPENDPPTLEPIPPSPIDNQTLPVIETQFP